MVRCPSEGERHPSGFAPSRGRGGGPADDFLNILGIQSQPAEATDSPVNPSVDYAMLHALNKNRWLFDDIPEPRLFRSLADILPEDYLKTNIKMLSLEMEERIASHFREENEHLLRRFVGLDERAAVDVYNSYFQPRASADRPYVDLDDVEIAYRCLGILTEALVRNHEKHSRRNAVVRPPYWKVPGRIAKRLAERRQVKKSERRRSSARHIKGMRMEDESD